MLHIIILNRRVHCRLVYDTAVCICKTKNYLGLYISLEVFQVFFFEIHSRNSIDAKEKPAEILSLSLNEAQRQGKTDNIKRFSR